MERLKWNFFIGVKQRPMVKARCHFGAFGVCSADIGVRTVLHPGDRATPGHRAGTFGVGDRCERGFAAATRVGVPVGASLSSALGETGTPGNMPGAAKSTLVREGLRVAEGEQAVTYPRRLDKLPTCKIPMNFIPRQLSSLKQLPPRRRKVANCKSGRRGRRFRPRSISRRGSGGLQASWRRGGGRAAGCGSAAPVIHGTAVPEGWMDFMSQSPIFPLLG